MWKRIVVYLDFTLQLVVLIVAVDIWAAPPLHVGMTRQAVYAVLVPRSTWIDDNGTRRYPLTLDPPPTPFPSISFCSNIDILGSSHITTVSFADYDRANRVEGDAAHPYHTAMAVPIAGDVPMAAT